MFGAIWALIAGGAIARDGVRNYIKDSNSRDRASASAASDSSHPGTYMDHRGRERLLSTNEIVYQTYLSNGDRVLKDKRGQIRRNFSEEIRIKKANEEDKYLQFAKENYDKYHTVIAVEKMKNSIETGFHNEVIYQDLQNGKKYVTRFFRKEYRKDRLPNYYLHKMLGEEGNQVLQLSFYMDITTGLLVRLSDSYLRWYDKVKKDAEKKGAVSGDILRWERVQKDLCLADMFIENFNKYQKDRRNELDLSNSFDFDDYYLFTCKDNCDTETDIKRDGNHRL